jgi:hypothetical protein
MFEDVLLDALSVVTTSRNHDFARTTAALSTIEGGLLVLVAGRLSAEAARELATARRHGRQGIALLLATSTWVALPPGRNGHDRPAVQDVEDEGRDERADKAAQNGHVTAGKDDRDRIGSKPAETAAAEAVFRAAGWQVVTIEAGTPLAVAWQRLPRAGSYLTSAGQSDLGVQAR